MVQVEKSSDLMLSTLRGCVEAVGGVLRLTVMFPGQREMEFRGSGEGDMQ